jgi:hypothetical protein
MFGGPVEQGVAPDDETEFRGEPRARPAAQLQHDREQGFLQPARLAGVGGNVGQPLAEDLALAGALVAEEAPRADAQDDRGARAGRRSCECRRCAPWRRPSRTRGNGPRPRRNGPGERSSRARCRRVRAGALQILANGRHRAGLALRASFVSRRWGARRRYRGDADAAAGDHSSASTP